jgi:D-alanine transaminase
MSRIAYVNGRYLPQSEASVNIEDRGYQFADGIYEVVHLYAGRLIDADRHLARLDRSLAEISLTPPMGIIYMQVTRGVARRDHAFPSGNVPPALVVTIRRTPPFPTDVDRWAGRAITHPDLRWARCDIKSVALLPNVLAKQSARAQGATEAILVRPDGMVTEGASTSVWIVDAAGRLRTRHLDQIVLPGCTRGALLALIAEAGIDCVEGPITEDDLSAAREVFLTSASSFVKPMVALDGKPVGDGAVGPVTRRLFALFAHHVKGGLRNAA